MPLTDFSVNKVRLWATVDGEDIELSRVELHYALNAIPDATLHCAIGREVRTLEPAPAHGVIDELTVLAGVTVYCEAVEVNDSGVSGGDWPVGPFVIFDGMVVGTASRKARDGSATLVIQCRHFLAGLEFSWSINKVTHPLNPGNFHQQAGMVMKAGDPVSFLVATLAARYFTTPNVEEDLWALSLKPWLEAICDQRQTFENEANKVLNDDAIGTLNRFEPFLEVEDDEPAYRFGVPLAMQNFDIIGREAGIQSIIADAATTTAQAFAGSTMWEKLNCDFAARYLFALVPMATRALVVPVIPGLNRFWVTIDPVEYDSVSINGFLPRPLRGVVIQTGANSMTGCHGLVKGGSKDITTIGGRFENDNMEKGMIYFRDGPQWLTNLVNPMALGKRAIAPNGIKADAAMPALGQPPLEVPGVLRAEAKNLWDEFAKTIYLYEVLKTRRGSITGKIRFDVAPGSSIKLITTEEKFVDRDLGGLGVQTWLAIVTAVSVMIDSDAAQGYTAIEFSHLRNEAEFNDENLTTDSHPLWTETWDGAPLVVEELPDPVPEPDEDD
jgi:hypothetical protein